MPETKDRPPKPPPNGGGGGGGGTVPTAYDQQQDQRITTNASDITTLKQRVTALESGTTPPPWTGPAVTLTVSGTPATGAYKIVATPIAGAPTVVSVKWIVDTGAPVVDSAPPFELAGPLGAGAHTVTGLGQDALGAAIGTAAAISVTEGTTPPPSGAPMVITGNVVTGPYQITSIPPAAIDAQVGSVEYEKDGSYWGTTTVRHASAYDSTVVGYEFWRKNDPIGPDTPFAMLGTGEHTVVAKWRNASGVAVGTPAQLKYWEGANAPPPDPTPPPVPAMFPATAVWNTPIDTAPVHPDNVKLQDSMWRAGNPLHPDFGTTYGGFYNGIPVNVVKGSTTPKKVVQITDYASESDPMPSGGVPIPDDVRIEGDPTTPGAPVSTGDRHALIFDTETKRLHEFYQLTRLANKQYQASFYGTWDTTQNTLRKDGWTSADAAGLPIANLLVNYDEIAAAVQNNSTPPHAGRFTITYSYLTTAPAPAWWWPARHATYSGDASRPKFGMRFRLKASFNDTALSPTNRAICRMLKRYGMFFADNGGDWYLSGSPDPRWNDSDLHILQDKILPSRDFELVDESAWMVNTDSAEAKPTTPSPPNGAGLTLMDVGTGLERKVTVEAAGQFRLVFEAADNWGLCQWYDLIHDAAATKNLIGPGCGSGSAYPCTDVTTAEPGLFQWVFYGTTPDDPKLYTRSAYYYFPNLPRSFTILEQTSARVVVEAMSHPAVTAMGTLDNVTGTVRYTIYPDGRIYVHAVLSVVNAQTVSRWFCGIMGLEDPGHAGEVPPDTVGWIRASASQNPYNYVSQPEPYLFAYFVPNTSGPYANFARASVLLVPRAGNPNQGGQIIHSWSHFVRWGYGMQNLSLPAGGSVTQDYLIQLGTQGSTVLPNIYTIAIASQLAAAYQAAPLP